MEHLPKLKGVALFSNMDDAELTALGQTMQHAHFAPGQVIIREGERGDSFHVIIDGEVAFLTVDSGGHEITLDKAEAGGWFGELSLLTGDPRSARVKAVSAVTTLWLDRESFRNFLVTHPHAVLDVLAVIGRRLAKADQLLRLSASRNVNELMEAKATTWQRVADVIARTSSSAPFVLTHIVWFGGWILWNVFGGDKAFDPYPFGLLTMVVSLEAIFLSIFVLVSQSRAGEKDRIAADIDHQVNLKAEQQTSLILSRLDDLERGMHFLHEQQIQRIRGGDRQ
jgi:CRP/FNR family transcriptional regulator, cyclic AMP receptor protein